MTPAGGRPVRVLHLGNATGLYGAERWILALVRHLPRAAVESCVGVVDDREESEPHPELCVEARRLGVATQVFRAPGRLSVGAIGALRAFVHRHAIDVVHTHGYKTDLIGLLALAGTRCRLIATPHGWTPGADWRLRAYEALDRASFALMDSVAPLSAAMHEELGRLPLVRRRLAPIVNGVDVGEIDAVALRSGAAMPGQPGGFHVGYVGRLVPGKRLDVLLDAFARLRVAGSRLTIVGDGPERGALEARARAAGIAEGVDFLGYRPDRLEILVTFDAFVLPSESEGIPRCLMEALAAGVYCIGTDIPGCRELLVEDAGGERVPVGDVDALVRALERAAADEARRRAVAEAGRRRVHERFSAARMAREYVALYQRVVS